MLRATPSRAIYQYRFGQPSLKQAFSKRIPAPAVAPSPGKLQETRLPNGVRVVSHDLDGAQATVGVYADAGPKCDPLAAPGLSYVMRFALQTSNMDSSLFQVDRAMRSSGSAYGHGEICKRYLNWKAEVRRDAWEKPFEALVTGVVAPRFHEADVERFRDTMDNQLEEMRWENPRTFVVDALETVAFYKEPLGSPRMVPKHANDRCGHKALLEQWAALFQPKSITIAAVNVPHDALIAAYEKLPYKHSAEAPHHARCRAPEFSHANEEAQFYPGRHEVHYEARAAAMGTKPDMEPEVIAAVGVAIPGGRDEDLKKYAAALVACEVYSASVRKSHLIPGEAYFAPQVFYRPYSSAALMGFTVRAAPNEVANQVRLATEHYPTSTSEADIATGKACATLRVYGEQLEMLRDYMDFIGTSAVPPEELMAAIQQVDKSAVDAVLQKAAAVKPACYATGDTFVFSPPSTLSKA